ncbi:MAG: (E)-4-hydroxy-3-methylbut-2-enyl-diphosphate synthase [Chitinophagaceae bacterium]|nr:(E)-4-hydroxy-3-methylbut-2-enyl-diphosphate synthase [Chitinophagaceae bacterium]
MQGYCESLTEYKRLRTREVNIGGLLMGNFHPIRIQTMTTTDTMDTIGTVEQSIRCIEAGAELVRITAPSKKDAENLLPIKNELHKRGYHTPLVADIHFTPNAAEMAARIVEKVRINPGNYIDKKKFEFIEYTDAAYQEEMERIRQRFTPLIKICKEYGTAMRIGTNHGSLSDRIMSRYGDTPMGMVESAMEFLRIARDENYHNIVLSMKASNPQIMVQAYRLLIRQMDEEFHECYPLHLGVTEAGDGEDGRIKSAIGIGALLEDGIGDTIRVSLTEDPEFEIPVCRDIIKRYPEATKSFDAPAPERIALPSPVIYSPYQYRRRKTFVAGNMGGRNVPVVVADLMKAGTITRTTLERIGYRYQPEIDKWNIGDQAADYILYKGDELPFKLPGTLKAIVPQEYWQRINDKTKYFPIYRFQEYLDTAGGDRSSVLNIIRLECFNEGQSFNTDDLLKIKDDPTVVFAFSSANENAMQSIRRMFIELVQKDIRQPVILLNSSNQTTPDEHLIHFSAETGALFLEGFGDGICLSLTDTSYTQLSENHQHLNASGRNYTDNKTTEEFINSTAFSILQATRTRISKTEYISCPSCGRTLFDLQETTAKIRAVTHHLKGVKIAVMGCIVNGPGEMADADFGYVGSGPGKITLYKGKEVVKRSINSEVAVEELINLLKESGVWVEP